MSFPQDCPNPGWWKNVCKKFTKVFTAFLDYHNPDGTNTGGDPPIPPPVAIPPVVQPAVANPSARLAVADTTNPLTPGEQRTPLPRSNGAAEKGDGGKAIGDPTKSNTGVETCVWMDQTASSPGTTPNPPKDVCINSPVLAPPTTLNFWR